jgi:type I restriction enzyme S subunit
MMTAKNWKTYRLGDLIEINKYSIDKNYSHTTIEYIDTASVSENNFSKLQILRLNEAPSRAKRIVKDGDIIYSTVRPNQRHYGFMKNAKSNTVVSTGFAVLTAKHINSKFLYYYLTKDEIVSYFNGIAEANTTTFPAFNASLFNTLEISIPDLPTQQRIASILSSLDDKIELNLQMNQTLESMAQILFQEMCVPKGKELPEGWRKGKLGEIVDINMGQSPVGTSYNQSGEGIIFFQGKAEFGFRFPAIDKYTTDPKKIADKFDTLLSVRAPVGTVNIATQQCCIGRGLAAIKSKIGCSSYTYYLLQSLAKIFDVYDSNGTVFGSINKNDLENIEIVIPNKDVNLQFEQLVKEMDNMIYNNTLQGQTLAQLRDSLLPKLMRGEIEV